MKKIIAILLSAMMLLTSCTQNIEPVESSVQNSTEIPQEVVLNEKSQKYLEDLNYLCDSLEQRCSGFWKHKDEFNMQKEKVIEKINSINSDVEFYCELQALVATLHNAHTNLFLILKILKKKNILLKWHLNYSKINIR